ncbi:MAG: hypothetical protein U5J78_06625 [Parasphingorhabdus sp.]|nr:hypothetical protein [Parasphingorhabdus sp.]
MVLPAIGWSATAVSAMGADALALIAWSPPSSAVQPAKAKADKEISSEVFRGKVIFYSVR